MRYRALAVLVLFAAAVHADDPVHEAAAQVYIAVRSDAQLTLQRLAKRDHPDPWLIAEELCFHGAHDAAAAFAVAVKDQRLAAYIESRREKDPDKEVRRAVRSSDLLRIANDTKEAWRILKDAEPPDDPVLEIRLYAARAKTLRDLGKHADSERWFLESGRLAHKLGWRRGATGSLRFLAHHYCFGTEGGASEMWLIRKRLEPGEAVIVYGRPLRDLLAAVIIAERTWYVPLGARAPIEPALAEFGVPRAGVPVLADELRARLVAPLELGQDVERVFVVPIAPLVDLPWVLLLGDREVVLGREALRVSAFGDWEGPSFFSWQKERTHGEGVLAVGRPRRAGSTAAEQEARAVGDTVLVGDRATWEAVEEASEDRLHWRALHIACPRTVAERWSRHTLSLGDASRSWTRWRAWFGEPGPELVVLSADESLRVAWKTRSAKGPHLDAPRTILSLWDVDPEATRVLMRRFYALWNGKVSLPACTALKLAQDFVRSHPAWKHPYYWAGWQLWASPPGEGGS